MKKLILWLVCVNTAIISQSQIEVTNAINFLKDGFLDDAKASIDKAENNVKNKESYKTYYYKGWIYQEIGISESPKYQKLCDNCFDIAFEAYLKALKYNFVNPDNQNIDLNTEPGLMQFAKIISTPDERNYKNTDVMYDIILNKLPALSNAFFNLGISYYQDKNYEKSYLNFEKAVTIATISFKVDTQLYYLTSLAALKYEKYEEAIKYSDLLITLNYGNTNEEKVANILNKAIALKNSGEEEKMLNTLEKGIKDYPDANYPLIIENFNYFVKKGENKKALEYINIAIDRNPENASLILIRGTLFEELKLNQEALNDYLTAISKDPDNYDANFNLGAFYFNTGVDTLQWAEKEIPVNNPEKYAVYKEIANGLFRQALPYLEKADMMKPDRPELMATLKTAYYRLGEMDKYYEISAKIDALAK